MGSRPHADAEGSNSAQQMQAGHAKDAETALHSAASVLVALAGLRLGGIDCLEPLKLAIQV